jgi:hypothetical protein
MSLITGAANPCADANHQIKIVCTLKDGRAAGGLEEQKPSVVEKPFAQTYVLLAANIINKTTDYT